MKKRIEQTQQEFLQQAKATLGVKWDEFVELTGIDERALKSYRLPASSKGHRNMNKFVKQAVIDAMSKNVKSKA